MYNYSNTFYFKQTQVKKTYIEISSFFGDYINLKLEKFQRIILKNKEFFINFLFFNGFASNLNFKFINILKNSKLKLFHDFFDIKFVFKKRLLIKENYLNLYNLNSFFRNNFFLVSFIFFHKFLIFFKIYYYYGSTRNSFSNLLIRSLSVL